MRSIEKVSCVDKPRVTRKHMLIVFLSFTSLSNEKYYNKKDKSEESDDFCWEKTFTSIEREKPDICTLIWNVTVSKIEQVRNWCPWKMSGKKVLPKRSVLFAWFWLKKQEQQHAGWQADPGNLLRAAGYRSWTKAPYYLSLFLFYVGCFESNGKEAIDQKRKMARVSREWETVLVLEGRGKKLTARLLYCCSW